MRFAVLILLIVSAAAHAQYGIGLSPGSSCPGQYGPAGQAVNGRDEVMNLQGQLAARNHRLEQLEAAEHLIDRKIARAKEDMAEVITAKGFAGIREHRERNNSYGSYSKTCGGGSGPVGAPGRSNLSGSAGSQYTDVELFSTGGSARAVDAAQTQYPPPDIYCVNNPATNQRENLWEKFVDDDGMVSDRICDFRIAGVTRSAGRDQKAVCRRGLHDYYRAMDEKARLRDEMARLDREARAFERRLDRVRDEIAEGTYCATCYAQRRGYANQGTGNSVMQGVGVLAMLGMSLMNNQRRPMPPPPPPMYRPPYGAPMVPYGAQGFPARPYGAPMPGYYGMQQGPRPGMANYGAVPGGIGPGAFACQGGNPTGFGGVQPIYGNQSPFNNPYANPAMANMFNQGGGPGWGFPQYGNGQPGFQTGPDAFGNTHPFGVPFAAQGPYGAPGPYGAQGPYGPNIFGGPNIYGPNQFAQQPWGGYPPGVLPYGGGSPYGIPYGGGYGAPYGAGYGGPYAGGYGAPIYAGGVPGYGAPMYGGAAPGYGYQGQYGNSFGLSIGAYFGQMNQLNAQVQWIQNGSYYGGGNYAAPYMAAPQPYYTAPVAPRAQPPAILPYTR